MASPSQLQPVVPQDNLIPQTDSVWVKLNSGESLTIPDNVETISPSTPTSPQSMGIRRISGGRIHAVFSDDTGVNEMADFKIPRLQVGDVVAVTAIAANVLTITLNGETYFTVTGTALNAGGCLINYF